MRSDTTSLLLLALLNVADLALTLTLLELGGVEGNPILAAAYERSAACFVGVKVGLAGFGIGILWRHRQHEAARAATLGGLLLYSAIVALHAVAIWHQLR